MRPFHVFAVLFADAEMMISRCRLMRVEDEQNAFFLVPERLIIVFRPFESAGQAHTLNRFKLFTPELPALFHGPFRVYVFVWHDDSFTFWERRREWP